MRRTVRSIAGNLAPYAREAAKAFPLGAAALAGADLGRFRSWTKKYNVRNPSDPRHQYDYVAAWRAGAVPKKWSSLPKAMREEDIRQGRKIPSDAYMWPDEYKLKGHPFPAKGKR